MNKLIIEMNLNEALPIIDLNNQGSMKVVFQETEYEFQLETSSIVSSDYSQAYTSLQDIHTRAIRIRGGDTLTLEGYAFNKKAKELSEAKSYVRKKQQEFKEAQRKLSELMGN